jgi:hypothetical protein
MFLMLSHDTFAMQRATKGLPRHTPKPKIIPTRPIPTKPITPMKPSIPSSGGIIQPGLGIGTRVREFSSSADIQEQKEIKAQETARKEAIATFPKQKNHLGNSLIQQLIEKKSVTAKDFENLEKEARAKGLQIGFIDTSAEESIKYFTSMVSHDSILQWKSFNNRSGTLLEQIVLPDNSIMLLIKSSGDSSAFIISRYSEAVGSSFLAQLPESVRNNIILDFNGKNFLKKKLNEASLQIKEELAKKELEEARLAQEAEATTQEQAEREEQITEFEDSLEEAANEGLYNAQEIEQLRLQMKNVKDILELEEFVIELQENILNRRDVSDAKKNLAEQQEKQDISAKSAAQAKKELDEIKEKLELQQKQIDSAKEEATLLEAKQRDLSSSLTEQKKEIAELELQKDIAEKEAQAQNELAAIKEQEVEAQKKLKEALDQQIAQMKAAQEAQAQLDKALAKIKSAESKQPSSEPTQSIKKPKIEPGTKESPAADLPERHIEKEIRDKELEDARLRKQQQKEEAERKLKQAQEQLLQAQINAANKKQVLESIEEQGANAQKDVAQAEKDFNLKKQENDVLEKIVIQQTQELAIEQKNLTAQQQAEQTLKSEEIKKRNEIEQLRLKQELASKEEIFHRAKDTQWQIELAEKKALEEKQEAEKAVQEAQNKLTSVEKQISNNIAQAQKDLTRIAEIQAREEQLARAQLSEIEHPGELTGIKKESLKNMQNRLEKEKKELLEDIQQKEQEERKRIEPIQRIEIPGGGGNSSSQNNQPIIPPIPIEEPEPELPQEPAFPRFQESLPDNEEEEILPEIEENTITPPRRPARGKPSESGNYYDREYTQKPAISPIKSESSGGLYNPIDNQGLSLLPLPPSFGFPETPPGKYHEPNIPRGSWTPSTPLRSSGGGYSPSYSSDWPTYEPQIIPEIKPQEPPQTTSKPRKLSPKAIEFFESINNVQSNIPSRQTDKDEGIRAYLKGFALLKQRFESAKKQNEPKEKSIIKKEENPALSFVKKITTTIANTITNFIETITNFFRSS